METRRNKSEGKGGERRIEGRTYEGNGEEGRQEYEEQRGRGEGRRVRGKERNMKPGRGL